MLLWNKILNASLKKAQFWEFNDALAIQTTENVYCALLYQYLYLAVQIAIVIKIKTWLKESSKRNKFIFLKEEQLRKEKNIGGTVPSA